MLRTIPARHAVPIRAIAFALAALAGLPASGRASDIRSTRHNLSVSGPGPIRAATETRVCVFCHTPHDADPVAPLWNRTESTAGYSLYSSSTLDAAPGLPTGASRLCLSCHDGTVALGHVLSEPADIGMAGGVTHLPPGHPANLGADLGDDHPVSFAYTPDLAATDGALRDPATLTGDVRLDDGGEVQCTTCHDPHDDTWGDFLVTDGSFGALCTACHAPDGWDTGSHAGSPATWDGAPPDPWPDTDWTTVAENACAGCHDPHGAAGPARLVRGATEEAVCFACHDGNPAATDLDAEFTKPFAHPIADHAGVHDPAEPTPVTTRHVECVDCHAPHAARGTAGGADPLGPLAGVDGIDGDGAPIDPATAEWQVCYRCHADSPGLPAPSVPRQVPQSNRRLQFDPANPSFHPVETAGANPNVPSLLPPWTESSVVRCSDCHGSDEGTAGGGTGPDGPHGSIWPGLLVARYDTADNTIESAEAYALCYRCHSRASILGNDSFDFHRTHIEDERAPCSICHDPHGVDAPAGTELNHTHLINFDTSRVFQHPGQLRLEFVDRGTFRGECTLRCHDRSHNAWNY